MKNLKKLMLLAVLAFCVMACMAAKPACAESSHGYIYGLGTSTGDISSITIYDNTTQQYEGNGYSLAWGGPWGAPSAIRFEADGLSVGHSYTLTVYPNGFDASYAQSMTATETGNGFKWPNMTFYGLY